MKKSDLSKIKEEMAKRKSERDSISTKLGENTVVNAGATKPKDRFLHELLESANRGVVTESSELVRKIANKTDGIPYNKSNEINTQIIPKEKPVQRPINEFEDREAQMYNDFKKSNVSLSETLLSYNKQPQKTINNDNQQINEGLLIENMKKAVNTYLNENFSALFEETMKNVIFEMFAVERVEKVLRENDDLIKEVVIKAIKELKSKSKQ